MSRKHRSCLAVGLAGLLLGASLALPGVARATVEGDQTPLTEEEIAQAIASGAIETQDEEPAGLSVSPLSDDSFFECYSGADRYEVSAMEALSAYSSSERVILAGSDGWADALGSAGLAGAWDCPILLTETNALNSHARQALVELGASSVTIVGGPNTVSPAVEQALKDMGLSVSRLGGADRYEVQMNIYDEVGAWASDTAIIASGVNYPDALSMSPVAFKSEMPIFLADSSGGLSDVQRATLVEAVEQGRLSQLVIAGGPDSVSYATEDFAKALLPGSVTRLGGADRYEASATIASWAARQGILTWDGVSLAMGTKPYDALCGSVLQGKRGSTLIVVDSDASNNAYAYDALRSNSGSIAGVRVFGGKASIPMTVRMDVADIFGIPYNEIPEFKVYVDAGHGQNDSNNGVYDPGACANGYQEATLTAELANKVADVLETRYGVDTFVNDDGGWYKLRHAEAQALGCDLIVSIHFNSGGGTGTESLIHLYNAHEDSWTLQDDIHPLLISGTTLRDRGQKQQEVAILGGDLPATLLEIGFIDSANDMSVYQSRKDVVAEKIAEGIVCR